MSRQPVTVMRQSQPHSAMSGFVAELRDKAFVASEAFVRRRKIDALCTDEDKVAPGTCLHCFPTIHERFARMERGTRMRSGRTQYWTTSLTSNDYPSFPAYAAHLLDELTNAMRKMSRDQVDDCAEYLSSRCNSKSLIVKTKALKAIKMLCQKAPAFRTQMAKHVVNVKQCTAHTGVADPYKGDALNKQVRDLANECVRAIFDVPKELRGGETNGGGRPNEFSSTLHLTSERARTGFQNLDATPQQTSPIIGDSGNGGPVLRNTGGSWGGESRVTERSGGTQREGVVGVGRGSTFVADSGSLNSRPVDVPETARNARFVSAVQSPESPTQSRLDAESRGRWTSGTSGSTQGSGSETGGTNPTTTNPQQWLPGSEEQRRVDEVCGRGGVRLAPSQEILESFAKACDGLRRDGVAAALADKLLRFVNSDDATKDAYKAVCAVEACCTSGGLGATDVAKLFAENNSSNNYNALRAAAAAGGALGEKAGSAIARVCSLADGGRAGTVGGAVGGTGASAQPSSYAQPTPQHVEFDFFGLGGSSSAVPSSSAAVDDLLGGLDLSGGGGLAKAHAQTPTQTPPQQHMGFAHPQMQQQMMQQQTMQQQMVQQNMMQQNMMRQNMVQQNMVQQNTTRPNTTHPQTAPSRGRGGPMSDAALGGGQSRYTQKKDVSAFDFVTDLLGTERKK